MGESDKTKDALLAEVSSLRHKLRDRGQTIQHLQRELQAATRASSAPKPSESQLLFEKIFHANPAAIALVHLATGAVHSVNDQFCHLTGYSYDAVLKQSLSDLALWEAPEVFEAIKVAIHQDCAVYERELRMRVRDGGVRTVLGSFQRVPVQGEPCLLMVVLDITDRKNAEVRLLQAKEQAEDLALLKSAFMTNVTHEIRTPLTVILGFTSMLRQGVHEDYQRFVQVIERSGRRLLRMLDSLVDLAQLEAGTLHAVCEPVNVSDIMRSVADSMRPLAEEKGLTFTVDDPYATVKARLDHEVLTRVLGNIVDNAIKFTERGHIALSVNADEHQIYLRVRDTGIGIDESFFPHMFKEFMQESTGLERTHQGTGLGLTVSKRLIELMGGSIHVESDKGKGSVFTICLPRSAREQVSA